MAKKVLMQEVLKENLKVLKLMNPTVPEATLKKILKKAIINGYRTPKVNITNNYTGEVTEMTLLDVIELCYSDNFKGTKFDKPIITGFGALYQNHNHGVAELSKAIQNLLDMRKVFKNKMFDHIKDTDRSLYKYYDLIQKIYKLLANSIYGVLGQAAAIFYNEFSAPAVTYTGVMAVTTAVNAFEAFLGNNFKFKNVDDIVKYIDNILSEERQYDFDDIFEKKDMISNDRLKNYLYSKLTNTGEFAEELLDTVIEPLSKKECTIIYYKNNLREFLMLDSIKTNFLEDAMINPMKVVQDGKEFMPDETKNNLDTLYEVLREWVVYYKIPFNRYEFAMTAKRRSSIVTDTDSTFLNLNYFVHYMGEEFNEHVDVKTVDGNLQVINVMIYILSKFISDFMFLLTTNMNVPLDYRGKLNMKSEYLYSRLMLTRNKKSYSGILVAQEGNLLPEPELDIKGMSIKKSNVNLPTRKFFTDVLENKILKEPNISMTEVLSLFKQYEGTIIREVMKLRNPEYLLPVKTNPIESYADPYKMKPLRGVIAWNTIYPNEQIRPPENCYLIPLISNDKIDSLEYLYKNHHDYFEAIKEKFYDKEGLNKYGMNAFCVPKDIKKIPDWIIPLIDIEKIVSNSLSSAEVLLNSLGIVPIKSVQPGSSSDKRLFVSNIIEF